MAGTIMTLFLASCGGATQSAEGPESTTTAPSTTSSTATAVAPTTTEVAPTTTAPPPSTTTTTGVDAQALEDVVGSTASGSGWRVEPGIYLATFDDVAVALDISRPVTYFESSGRLDFGPEEIIDSSVPDWVSIGTYVGVIPPERVEEHVTHDPLVPPYTADLPSDMGLYLQTIPQLLVEAAESIQGDGFTAEAWNVMVDPSQGGTFPCFLGSCVSVLVSEIGGVFVFGSDAAARVWQFDGKGEGVYGYLQSRPESFDDTVAIAEMLFANLVFGSP